MAQSSMESMAVAVIRSLVTHSPLILVELLGLIFALTHWRRSTGAARFALPGFGLLLFGSVVVGSCWAILPQWLIDQGWQSHQLEAIFTIVGLSSRTVEAVGIACLAVALFYGRSATPQ